MSSSLPQLSEFPTVPREGVTFVSDKKTRATHRLPPSLLPLLSRALLALPRIPVSVFTAGDLSMANRESLCAAAASCLRLSSLNDRFLVKGRSNPPSLPCIAREKRDAYRFVIFKGSGNINFMTIATAVTSTGM